MVGAIMLGNDMSPEELAEVDGKPLEELAEITDLKKLTLDHVHSLLHRFKSEDDREVGMDLNKFSLVFGRAFQSLAGETVSSIFEKIGSDEDGRIHFSHFSHFLIDCTRVEKAYISAFRTSGITLPGDEDSPLKARCSKSVALPPINDLSKMTLKHMQALSMAFNSNDNGEGLAMEDFVSVVSDVLHGMDPAVLEAQFMKIDANSDGTVSWDEFSSYILALGTASESFAHKFEGGNLLEGPEPDPNRDEYHSHAISHITCHHGAEKYFTIALEDKGTSTKPAESLIRQWNSKADASAEILGATAKLTGNASVVLAVSVFGDKYEWRNGPAINVLAVSSVDGRIRFFDCEKLLLIGELDCVDGVCTAMHNFRIKNDSGPDDVSLDFGGEEKSKRTQRLKEEKEYEWIFAYGDDEGNLRLFTEESIMESCRRSSYLTASFNFMHMKLCKDWLTWILWIDETELLCISTNDAQVLVLENRTARDANGPVLSLSQILRSRRKNLKLNVKNAFQGHSMSVKTCAWCSGRKIMASAGLDRSVILWDPLFGRVSASLTGHKKAIFSLQYKERRDILISLDLRSVCNFWDPSNLALLLSIEPPRTTSTSTIGVISAIFVNNKTDRMIFGNKKLQVWQFKRVGDTGDQAERYHKGEIVAALVNHQFYQIVLVDSNCFVTVWDISTGKQNTNFFAESKHDDEIPTCARFDDTFRRLVVLYSQGSIRIFNFSNGTVINNLTCDSNGPLQTTTIITKEEKGAKKGSDKQEKFLLASGWNGSVYFWYSNSPEEDVKNFQKLKPRGEAGANEEVRCMAFYPPCTLVTGYKDGHVIVWNTITYLMVITHHFSARSTCEIIQGHIKRKPHAPSSARGSSFAARTGSSIIKGMLEPLRNKIDASSPSSTSDSRPGTSESAANFWSELDSVLAKTSQVQQRKEDGGAEINAVEFLSSPGFEGVALVACGDGMWRFLRGSKKFLWGYVDARSRACGGEETSLECFCTSEDGRWVVSGNSKGYVQVWELKGRGDSLLTDRSGRSGKFDAYQGETPQRIEGVELSEQLGLLLGFKGHEVGIKSISFLHHIARGSATCNVLLTVGKEFDSRVIMWSLAGEKLAEFGGGAASEGAETTWSSQLLLEKSDPVLLQEKVQAFKRQLEEQLSYSKLLYEQEVDAESSELTSHRSGMSEMEGERKGKFQEERQDRGAQKQVQLVGSDGKVTPISSYKQLEPLLKQYREHKRVADGSKASRSVCPFRALPVAGEGGARSDTLRSIPEMRADPYRTFEQGRKKAGKSLRLKGRSYEEESEDDGAPARELSRSLAKLSNAMDIMTTGVLDAFSSGLSASHEGTRMRRKKSMFTTKAAVLLHTPTPTKLPSILKPFKHAEEGGGGKYLE
ncbi:hypothetical protein GUITHDRAFT_106860 [Guillardia theta CCMP2712]|uniref:EF-hand domain-containing protein n=1 Tax=Guillardia theta (strain CCMP2712) TaxID=905079 RepID=L1JGH7_GUITC|nr:hypothetical protein GUITHDRAFT_106860 [Guillardia theta CCMP2712]EKX47417.1 hypothetical protein GUITHDRAFT_106860 [Guillardia theta CCMP2712]|eukprot:XP_005834397.1 hypothetical protein GUITHDRAFT_106860 [Guillardia theta CCMP2712]